jgi:YfiR/HmsC-like
MIARQLFSRAMLFGLCAVFGGSPAHAALFSADSVKAAFLYRFASYVEWPDDAPATGPFVIAVAGAEPVAKQLDILLPRMTVHGRSVIVRRVTKATDLDGVQILYIGAGPLSQTRVLRERAIDKPILIVTDDEKGLDAGGIINFLAAEKNVRFEVSLAAADRARLKVDAALLSVAARVERRPFSWSGCADPNERSYRKSGCALRVAAIDVRGGL